MTDELRARIAAQVHRVAWEPLAPHDKRGGLVMVDPALDLIEVALAVADDDTEKVEAWMNARQLTRATEEQTAAWDQDADARFAVVIVQPYVLAQVEA